MGLARPAPAKTAAFGTPLVQILNGNRRKACPQSLTCADPCATRELAAPRSWHLTSYIGKSHLKVTMIVVAVYRAADQRMERGTDIMVCPPRSPELT